MSDAASAPGTAEPAASATPRRYLFGLTDAGGTVPPELGVARRLVDRGHRVTVLADDSMEGAVRRTGAAFRSWLPGPATEFRDWELKSPTSLARGMADDMFAGPAPRQAEHTIAAIDELQPDLVVTSFVAVGAMIGADARGVPFDVLIPNIYALPAKGKTPGFAGMSPAHGPLGRLRDRVMNSASTRMFDRYALEPVNAARAEYDLAPLDQVWDQMRHARRQLVLTAESFDFPFELPGNARYVGPILDDPAWAGDQEWTPPAGDEPLVLVAMSSTFQNHVDCLQRITDALGSLPVRGVVTTGPAVSPDEIRAPANVRVVASAPHSQVLRHADLVVTHGGHGTVIKTLAAGVPLVILHHGRDQSDNAIRVTSRGAGIAVSRRAPSQRIAREIATVLATSGYRNAAQEFARSIAREVEDSALVGELEAID